MQKILVFLLKQQKQDTVTYVTALASLIAAQERNGEDHGTRVSLAARL